MRPLSERWQRRSESQPDAADRPPHDYRLFLAGQKLYGAALVLHALFIALFAQLGVPSLALFNALSVGSYMLCLWLNRRGRSEPALWIAFVEVHLHASLAVVLVGWDTGFAYYLLATGPLLFLHTGWPMAKKFLAVLVPVALLAGLHHYSLTHPSLYAIVPAAKLSLYDFNLLATLAVLSYLAYFYSKGAHESEGQLRAVSRSLEEQAATDPLTGLLNRRAMIREIESEISRFERQPRGFVLAIGDLDGFKEINDRYGHDAGDLVLKQVATIMTEFLRSHDVTSRWGGEEFVILLPDTDIDGGLDTVDRLRERLAQPDIVFQGEALAVSITFGLCAYEAGMSRDACLKRADEALYRGKQMGRNRVVVA